MDAKHIYEKVQERYSSVATNLSGKYEQKVARAFGYTIEELETIPQDANLGLSCGNPLALAKLKEVCCTSSSYTKFPMRAQKILPG
jgi:arsenite methyltransferase